MDKQTFDILWKIALVIILTVSIVYMFNEWKSIDREAMACKNSPFVWGQLKAKEKGITCTYHCSDDNAVLPFLYTPNGDN